MLLEDTVEEEYGTGPRAILIQGQHEIHKFDPKYRSADSIVARRQYAVVSFENLIRRRFQFRQVKFAVPALGAALVGAGVLGAWNGSP